jgi:hypothetical protein
LCLHNVSLIQNQFTYVSIHLQSQTASADGGINKKGLEVKTASSESKHEELVEKETNQEDFGKTNKDEDAGHLSKKIHDDNKVEHLQNGDGRRTAERKEQTSDIHPEGQHTGGDRKNERVFGVRILWEKCQIKLFI